jgi:hypothetical protein
MSGFSQVLPAVEKGARMKLIGTAGQLAVQTIYAQVADMSLALEAQKLAG